MSEASLHGDASRSFARDEATHSRKGLRVKFNHNVELYVGDEHEHFFKVGDFTATHQFERLEFSDHCEAL